MKFSYVRLGNMKPKVKVFKCCEVNSKRASRRTIRKVDAWFSEKGDSIKVYKMRAVTKKGFLGLWVNAFFYVFYKDIPR